MLGLRARTHFCLDDLIVISSFQAVPRGDIPRSVTVIGRHEISLMNTPMSMRNRQHAAGPAVISSHPLCHVIVIPSLSTRLPLSVVRSVTESQSRSGRGDCRLRVLTV